MSRHQVRLRLNKITTPRITTVTSCSGLRHRSHNIGMHVIGFDSYTPDLATFRNFHLTHINTYKTYQKRYRHLIMPRFGGGGRGEALRQAHVTQKFFDQRSPCTYSEPCTHTIGTQALAHANSTLTHVDSIKLETMLETIKRQEADHFKGYMVCVDLWI